MQPKQSAWSHMLAGFEGLYEESLPALLMDVDSIEGKLPRRDERDSDEDR